MGLFNKNKPKTETDVKAEANTDENFDPVLMAAHLIARTEAPGLSLGVLILYLLQGEAVSFADLARLGMSEDEIGSVFSAFQEDRPANEIAYELEVRAATRQYDQQLTLLAVRRGIEPDTPEFTEFRSVVARFAYENELTNLSAAYRLMVAECPDQLPGRTPE